MKNIDTQFVKHYGFTVICILCITAMKTEFHRKNKGYKNCKHTFYKIWSVFCVPNL